MTSLRVATILPPMPDSSRKLLLIGLDAAEASLVERWTDDGTLPTLRALRAGGTWGRLSSSARYLTGSPWPTFYTGRPPSDHGIYHDFQWRQEQMAFVTCRNGRAEGGSRGAPSTATFKPSCTTCR